MREIAKSQFLSFLFELNQLGNFPEVGEGGGEVRAKFRARFSHFLFFFFLGIENKQKKTTQTFKLQKFNIEVSTYNSHFSFEQPLFLSFFLSRPQSTSTSTTTQLCFHTSPLLLFLLLMLLLPSPLLQLVSWPVLQKSSRLLPNVTN